MERILWDNVTPLERCHTAAMNQWAMIHHPLCRSRQATEMDFVAKIRGWLTRATWHTSFYELTHC